MARTQVHSSSATTPRKFFTRTTLAPRRFAIDDSSTETSSAPTAGGRITRPCSMFGTLKSCMKMKLPVTLSGTSGRGSDLPTMV